MTTQAPPPISRLDLLDQPASSSRRYDIRGLLPSLLLSAIVPFVVYTVLTGQGVADVTALIVAGVFPVLGLVWSLARTRRADVIGLISLAFIIVGVATSVLTGNAQFILIKESMLTGVFGLICLFSLLAPKPLMFYFGRQFASGGDPVRAAAFEDLWQYPQFRAVQRNITVAWAAVTCSRRSPALRSPLWCRSRSFSSCRLCWRAGVTIALIAWTMAYARRASQRGSAHLAAEAARAHADA